MTRHRCCGNEDRCWTDRAVSGWSAFWEAMGPPCALPTDSGPRRRMSQRSSRGTHLRSPSAVLDLGCGSGAHAVAFARLGHRVTGVDTSPRLLDRARSAASTESIEVEWVEADMRRFRRPSTFDHMGVYGHQPWSRSASRPSLQRPRISSLRRRSRNSRSAALSVCPMAASYARLASASRPRRRSRSARTAWNR
jgi:SAM-dependent methyltransferase